MTTAERARNTETATSNIVRISADRYLVPSRTTVGQQYLVVRNAEGELVCDCDAAINRRHCWHLQAVAKLEAGRAAGAPVAKPATTSRLSDSDRKDIANLLRGIR